MQKQGFSITKESVRHVFFRGSLNSASFNDPRTPILEEDFHSWLVFLCNVVTHTHTLDNRQRHQISWGLSRFFKPDVGEPSTLDCVLWVTDVALDVYGITWLPKEHCHWMMISTKLGRENLWGIHGYLGCYVGFHLDLLKKMEVSKIIFMFTSGEMIQFDQHIFEMGGSTIN